MRDVPVVLFGIGVSVAAALAMMGYAAMENPSALVSPSRIVLADESPVLNIKVDELDSTMVHPALYIAPVEPMPIDETTKLALNDQQMGTFLVQVQKRGRREFFKRGVDPLSTVSLGAGP